MNEQMTEEQKKELVNKALETLEEPAKKAALALLEAEKEEQASRDAAIGITPEMPERVKIAVRNMSYQNRRLFFKKVMSGSKMRKGKYRKGMSEATFKLYMDTFAPGVEDAKTEQASA